MRILGVDPGYERLGLAVLEKTKGKELLIYSECFRTSPKKEFVDRLCEIGSRVADSIKKYKPDALAIENLFIEKNQKTAMRVSEVRGVILYEARCHNLRIAEYTPLQVKLAVTSYGKSDKKQVESMVRKLLALDSVKKMDDEIDAIAIALTGSASLR